MASQPEPISGARTIDGLESAQRIIEMYPAVILLSEDKPGFSMWLNQLKTRPVNDIKFQWQTDEIIPPNDTTTASAASGATQIALTGDGTDECYVKVNDLLYVPASGEQLLVTAVSARNVTVTRSFGDTAAASIASGATIVRASSSWQEMSTLRDSNDAYIALTTQSSNNFNYTQFAREAVAIGHRQLASALNAGEKNFRDLQQLKKALEVLREQNVNKMFGDIALSGSRSAAGGLWRNVPSANRETITTLTEDEIEDFVRAGSLDGSGQKRVLHCDRLVKQKLSQLYGDRMRVKPGSKQKVGIEVTELITGTGVEIDVVADRVFEESGHSGGAVLVDPANMAKCVFDGYDMKLYENVQQNDQHGTVDEIVDDSGLQWGHASHHRRMSGVVA